MWANYPEFKPKTAWEAEMIAHIFVNGYVGANEPQGPILRFTGRTEACPYCCSSQLALLLTHHIGNECLVWRSQGVRACIVVGVGDASPEPHWEKD